MEKDLTGLEFIIGHWRTKGEVIATKDSEALKVIGTDTYEWTLGGSYILHRADIVVGEEKVEVLELIGDYDKEKGIFMMWSFDNTGTSGMMEGHLPEPGMLKIQGREMRAVLNMIDSRHMTANWERSKDDKHWKPWIDMTFTRIDG